mgnify:CR=1 FL=1
MEQRVIIDDIGEVLIDILGGNDRETLPITDRMFSGEFRCDGGAGMARETRRRLARADLLAEDGPGELILESSADDPAEIRLCRELLEQEMEDGR